MQLRIEDPDNMLEVDFIEWLKSLIKDTILESIQEKKLTKFDIFFKNNSLYTSIDSKSIKASEIIKAGANNLDHIQSSSNFQIRINPNIYAINFDRVKLDSLCKLINYGNIDISGYPIFTDIFNYFADNIHKYLEIYIYTVRKR